MGLGPKSEVNKGLSCFTPILLITTSDGHLRLNAKFIFLFLLKNELIIREILARFNLEQNKILTYLTYKMCQFPAAVHLLFGIEHRVAVQRVGRAMAALVASRRLAHRTPWRLLFCTRAPRLPHHIPQYELLQQ